MIQCKIAINCLFYYCNPKGKGFVVSGNASGVIKVYEGGNSSNKITPIKGTQDGARHYLRLTELSKFGSSGVSEHIRGLAVQFDDGKKHDDDEKKHDDDEKKRMRLVVDTRSSDIFEVEMNEDLSFNENCKMREFITSKPYSPPRTLLIRGHHRHELWGLCASDTWIYLYHCR